MLDPKIAMLLNIVVAVAGALAGGAALLTDALGAGLAKEIIAIAGLTALVVGAVNGAMHGYSAPTAGPLVDAPPSQAKKLIVLLALLPLLGACATINKFLAALDADVAKAWAYYAQEICPHVPQGVVAVETIACIAKANKTTQGAVDKSIALARQICNGGPPPSVKDVAALRAYIERAYTTIRTAQAAGCGG